MMNNTQPPRVVTPIMDGKNQALTEKVQAVLTSLDNYEKTRNDLFMKLETVIQYLPENTSLETLLGSQVLEKVDVIFLASCELGPRNSIKRLAKGPWKMKPYQFIEHWGYEMREKPLFLRKLIKLSALMSSLTDSVAAIRAQRPDTSTEIPKNGKREQFKAKDIEKVIRTVSSEGTAGHRRVKAKQNKTSIPVILMETPKSVVSEFQYGSPSASCETVGTLPPHGHNGCGATPGDAIEISDEEFGSPSSHSATVYEDTLRQKCIKSLQRSNSWLIEDVFGAVLPMFTSHDERTLVIDAGLINVDNPISNRGKKIRALKKSHELLLIPLNIGKSHWIFALLSLTERKALIYDPLHSEYSINRAKTALGYFVEGEDKFGRSANWTFVKHPVSTLLSFSSLAVGRADT